MKQIINNFIMAAGLALLVGCSDDNAPGSELASQDRGLELAYRVDGEMPLSRSLAATAHETALRQVHVLFFEPDNEAFVGYAKTAVAAGSSKFSLDPPASLDTNVGYRVLAIGNGDTFVKGDYTSLSSYLDSFRGTLTDAKAIIAAYEGNVTSAKVDALPLWGRFLDGDGNELTFTKVADGENFKVSEAADGEFLFSRAICRVDIHNLVGQLLDVRYARIANNRTEGYYFTDGLMTGTIAEMNTNINDPTSSDLYMPITTDMIPGETTTQRLEASLYTFPNVVGTTVQNDKVTTCLLIAGYYTDPETNVKDTELTFYRFNLANVGESQALQRNYAYLATIKGVKRRGASDEKGAYNDNVPIFEYQVDDEWDTTGDNVVSDAEGNFLIVNKTHLTFQGDASEADFIELRVSTNPDMDWKVEAVEIVGHSNDKFVFEKVGDNAVKVGPLEQNTQPYIRYGYYKITAVNPKTNSVLYMPIYLMQLSTMDKVRTLTVNGCTGTLNVDLPPDGGAVKLLVVTGDSENGWVVDDASLNRFSALFGSDVSRCTGSGGHNSFLEIYVTPNISKADKTCTMTVSLAKEDDNVEDVILNLIQKPSSKLITIVGFPENSRMTINAFSTESGNPGGVVEPKWFQVNLADPNLMYKVETDFDYCRDLRLSKDYNLQNDTKLGRATQPAGGHPEDRDVISGLTNGQRFWINPYRMGPGDLPIDGTVTVSAYSAENPDDILATERFSVTLESSPVKFNDILLKYSATEYYLYPDRSLGMTPRYKDGMTTPIDAQYFTYKTNFLITGLENNPPYKNTGFDDQTLYQFDGYTLIAPQTGLKEAIPQFLENHADEEELHSPFYHVSESGKWSLLPAACKDCFARQICYSKGRAYLVSSVPYISKGKEVPVVCWMQQPTFKFGSDATEMASFEGVSGRFTSFESYYSTELAGNWLLVNDQYNCRMGTFYRIRGNFIINLAVRPIRLLSSSEIESYKKNYLGY